jgi:hypothetical protein
MTNGDDRREIGREVDAIAALLEPRFQRLVLLSVWFGLRCCEPAGGHLLAFVTTRSDDFRDFHF